MAQGRTPSQTIGPFFHEALRWKDGGRVTFAEAGQAIVLAGRVLDGAGAPVTDAMVETWQLSPLGRTPAAACGDAKPHGFGRVETGPDGRFRIETAMPGGELPCIDVAFFARGLLKPLRTRVYLAPLEKVRADPVLKALSASERVKTLVAEPTAAGEYRWDVRLQGEGETVFFAA
ncbi:MAG TPA: protocatechuate 3,4-dioxygenase subunit alpha [Usitatibacter sp.]|jgi:protocatechuate 3,4-dioxygenase alpha subunit|nr:protocatechuate 3,4-dioxygenase subunit alpha [Usitatibacter sp.]